MRAALLPRRKRSKLEVRYDYVADPGRVHDKTDKLKFTDLFLFLLGRRAVPTGGEVIPTHSLYR